MTPRLYIVGLASLLILAIASYFAFCILIFDVFVSHLFDVIRYFSYIEEENDLQYSEYDRYYKAYLCVCLSVSL